MASELDHQCLLHSGNRGKSRDAFWKLINQQLAANDCDFCGYAFPDEADFSDTKFLKEADFTEAEFSAYADFSEAQFSEQATFRNVNFSGGASFRGSKFSKRAEFVTAKFSEQVDFSGAQFSEQADFGGAQFTDRADFVDSVFSGFASFRDTEFSGWAHFTATKFPGDAYFSRTKFLGEATFRKAEFSGGTSFSETEFSARASFRETEFSGRTDFKTDLQRVTFRSTNLRLCRFALAFNIDKAEFEQVEWADWRPSLSRWRKPRLAIADELDARRAGLRSWQEAERRLRTAERVYRGLRASYEAHKDSPRLGEFYFAEMEVRRLASSSSWFGQTFGSLTAWYGLISGYGERWGRALGWAVGVWLLWALLYVVVGLWIKTPAISDKGTSETHLVFVGLAAAPAGIPAIKGALEQFAHALVHSFLVATLIGRDVYAQPINPLGQVVQTAEIVLGPLLLGLMGLAIRRRFQR